MSKLRQMKQALDLAQGAAVSDEELFPLLRRFVGGVLYLKGCQDEELIEDIAVDIFLKKASFGGNSKFSTWVFRAVANEYIDHLRAHSKMEKAELEEIANLESSNWHDTRPEELEYFLGFLSEEAQTILKLFVDNHTFTEIGEILGYSKEQIKRRYKLAVERIKRLKKEQDHE